MDAGLLNFVFHGPLQKLLPLQWRSEPMVRYPLTRRASLKDIIASLSIPHTEVWRLTLNGKTTSLHHVPVRGGRCEVYPHSFATAEQLKRACTGYDGLRFLTDSTVRKLARFLRLLGFDTVVLLDEDVFDFIEFARIEQRIVLSRNRELLKRKGVVYGQLLYSDNHLEQLEEVLCRTPFAVSQVAPFSRCMLCNGILQSVNKEEVLDQLEPLTKKYYTEFKRCGECLKVYWKGSHHDKLEAIIADLK